MFWEDLMWRPGTSSPTCHSSEIKCSKSGIKIKILPTGEEKTKFILI